MFVTIFIAAFEFPICVPAFTEDVLCCCGVKMLVPEVPLDSRWDLSDILNWLTVPVNELALKCQFLWTKELVLLFYVIVLLKHYSHSYQ